MTQKEKRPEAMLPGAFLRETRAVPVGTALVWERPCRWHPGRAPAGGGGEAYFSTVR